MERTWPGPRIEHKTARVELPPDAAVAIETPGAPWFGFAGRHIDLVGVAQLDPAALGAELPELATVVSGRGRESAGKPGQPTLIQPDLRHGASAEIGEALPGSSHR